MSRFVRISSSQVVDKDSKAGKAFIAKRTKELKASQLAKKKAKEQAEFETSALALAEAEALVAEATDKVK